jgi:WD40 repeat protein
MKKAKPKAVPSSRSGKIPDRAGKADKALPPGVTLRYTLRGHKGELNAVAVTPDGRSAISASADSTLKVWDLKSGQAVRTLEGHTDWVFSVAVTPEGHAVVSVSPDKTLKVWDLNTGIAVRTLEGHTGWVYGVAVTPDGQAAISGSRDCTLRVWDLKSGRLLQVLEGHTASVVGVAVTPDGHAVVSVSLDKTLKVWDLQSGQVVRTLEGHRDAVLGVAVTPDGQAAISASMDRTLKVWDLKSGQVMRTLEGHTDSVIGVAVTPDGKTVVSGSIDGTVKVWDLDWNIILGTPPETPQVQYTNAKVVLVGDTGVGKTGLGLVLTGQKFVPIESTGGRNVWTLESSQVKLPNGQQETREILLWDLAGQPGYRLIHQLSLTETAVALVVFDARSETEPFAGVRHWDRALRQARRVGGESLPMKKLLVAARTDRGGISVSRARIDEFVRDGGFAGYLETSAKEGWNVTNLAEAIRKAIDWEALPKVNSTELFQQIKAFLLEEKKAGRLLSTADDLYRAFLQVGQESPTPTKNRQVSGRPSLQSLHSQTSLGMPPESADVDICRTQGDRVPPPNSFGGVSDDQLRAQFETCIGRVESRGLIRQLSFGNFVLLQPELLDAYASAMVNAAKEEPDGLGCIAEEDALAGRFKMSEKERLENKDQEKLLLIATMQELLKHEIALKEVSDGYVDIVFPSQFTRERPDAPDLPGKTVVFTFEGPLLNIYATLAVRLSHSRLFKRNNMWRNAASFEATVRGTCGIYLRELEEGKGELILCFDDAASETTRFQFEDYVATHLKRRSLPNTIQRRRIFVCPQCEEPVTDGQAQKRRARGFDTINCNVCDTEISLLDREERLVTPIPSAVADMDKAADEKRDFETAAMTLKGKIATGDFDVFLCYNSKDKEAVKKIGEQLKEHGILPWLDEWNVQPGQRWQKELKKQISKIKSAAVFIGPRGAGPWQEIEVEDFIQQFLKRKCPVIPVILPECEKISKLPSFLNLFQWVDFRKSDPDPLEQLIWGITGERTRFQR